MSLNPNLARLERQLKGLRYPDIERELANLATDDLIRLLDAKSIKVGDSAAGLIFQRDAYPPLINAALEGRLTTKLGKIRAPNILLRCGRKYPAAFDVYLKFVQDRNDEVAHNALQGLVFWGDKRAIPAITKRFKQTSPASEFRTYFESGLRALAQEDPKIFAPNYTDLGHVWDR